ncbi:MAG: carboxypeptidase M32 [Truepera sp.]|nr:carboxypeptidase M32 [Truepera sp.]
MTSTIESLRAHLVETADLTSAAALLSWDQNTHMPPAAAAERGRQLAALYRVIHQRLIDPELGRILDELEGLEDRHPANSDVVGLIRVARHRHQHSLRVPTEFRGRQAEHQAGSYQNWLEAWEASDFGVVEETLETTLDLSLEFSSFFPEADHPADPHIATADTGLTTAEVSRVFGELRASLVPLVQRVAERPGPDSGVLYGPFPREAQVAFALDVARDFGFDFGRGNWAWTHHPFAAKISPDDVRITTRASERHLGDGVFATLHEVGHGLYNQGAKAAGPILDGGLGRPGGFSTAIHESQSRLWENLVGRSLPFWQHYYPTLQDTFPEALHNLPLERFYATINKVEPSLIRTGADELTYNLHIMIRVELERALLEGSLPVRELPEAWRASYLRDLGIEPERDREGVLQDVHWYSGLIGGAFQGYTLGNVLGAQFFEAAKGADVEVEGGIGRGEFGPLLGWLQDTIYRHGIRFSTPELVERVTGKRMTTEPYLRYLTEKFGRLYGLD